MSGTAWRPDLRRDWLELVWGGFVAANLIAVALVPAQVPIPFHFIWISLALVYGVRAWRLSVTLIALLAVMLLGGAALAFAISEGRASTEEYSEIPLMAIVFLAMVLHVRRRQAATREVNRLAEDRARLLDREHDFLRDASHQLRTPITVARGYAELMAQDCLSLTGASDREAARLQDDARVVIDELDRLTHISDGLLLLAAAERPEFLKRAPVRVDELVDEVAARWQSVAPRRWRVHAATGAVVSGDRQRLRSALDALLDNAIAFTAEGDAIIVRATRGGDDVLLEVADSGPGLSTAIMGRVFERFASDDTGRSTGRSTSRGTGLGLAGVRAIVGAHGGSVSAGNRPEGGAWFRLRLPALAGLPAQATADTIGPPAHLGSGLDRADLPPEPAEGAAAPS
jgi:two-component system, OmpR family, sensor kinase